MTEEVSTVVSGRVAKEHATLADYLAIARLDHATKHIFILPGIVLAQMLRGVRSESPLRDIALGLVAALAVASANYVINEWLDRDYDRHHPTKSQRSAVQRELQGHVVALEWSVLVLVGLGSAYAASATLFWVACVFALQGLVYNVPPIRAKDKPYIDVISESINNPLRLMIGWVMIDPTSLPPASLILSYWLGGAFLMAAKRLCEYREIAGQHGRDLLVNYRASFAGYTDVSLSVSCFVYGMLSSFFLAIFLIKYRIEYILVMPPITILFAHYVTLAMRPGSSAQAPEKLYRERGLIFLLLGIAALFALTSLIDIPSLESLTSQRYIKLG
jgi:4-hydroxybenzoate polyprenyltransferase